MKSFEENLDRITATDDVKDVAEGGGDEHATCIHPSTPAGDDGVLRTFVSSSTYMPPTAPRYC